MASRLAAGVELAVREASGHTTSVRDVSRTNTHNVELAWPYEGRLVA